MFWCRVAVKNLRPVNGKFHWFLFLFKIEPVSMWRCTILMSMNYYASMISYGVMSRSDKNFTWLGICIANTVYCFVFLLLLEFLLYREMKVFEVGNFKINYVCLSCNMYFQDPSLLIYLPILFYVLTGS